MMLEGKLCLVTGGSGAIGAAICRAMVREGATVAFTYLRGEERAQALLAELASKGATARADRVDVSDRASVQAWVAAVEAALGAPHVLVNNAALAQIMAFPLIDEEDVDALMDANVKGPFLVTKAVARHMIAKRRGAIVNLGSLAGERIMEVPAHYAATKASMGGFTRSLAWELSRFGIRVNCVVPGLIAGGVGDNVPEKQRKQYESFCTLHRLGLPEEVAEVVVFLASDRCSYVNGQSWHVDGGI